MKYTHLILDHSSQGEPILCEIHYAVRLQAIVSRAIRIGRCTTDCGIVTISHPSARRRKPIRDADVFLLGEGEAVPWTAQDQNERKIKPGIATTRRHPTTETARPMSPGCYFLPARLAAAVLSPLKGRPPFLGRRFMLRFVRRISNIRAAWNCRKSTHRCVQLSSVGPLV